MSFVKEPNSVNPRHSGSPFPGKTCHHVEDGGIAAACPKIPLPQGQRDILSQNTKSKHSKELLKTMISKKPFSVYFLSLHHKRDIDNSPFISDNKQKRNKRERRSNRMAEMFTTSCAVFSLYK